MHSRRRVGPWAVALAAVLVTALGAVFFHFLLPDKLMRIDPRDSRQVTLGGRLYQTACASCHGASLEGQPNWQRRLPNGRLPAPPHDATGHSWHHADAHLFRVTKLGPAAYPAGHETDMPAFGASLSDEQIAAILAFIKSKWPADIQARQERLNSR